MSSKNPIENTYQMEKSPNSSSSSTSSSEGNGYLAESLTYACDCLALSSIINPLVGKDSSVTYKGFFSPVEGLVHRGTPHVRRGGLERTLSNRGTFFCSNAGKLFSLGSGGVRMRIILPYDISSGVYEPLSSIAGEGAEIEDYVIWAVHMGESYISQPGIYAALTPYGIEFTIWSSAGRHTILDTSTNHPAGEELLLEFFWDKDHLIEGGNMSIHSNGSTSVRGNATINDNPISNLYNVVNESYSITKHAEFVAFDSPYGNHGLNCVVTWLETHSSPPARNVRDNNSSSSSSSQSPFSQSMSSSDSSSMDDVLMAAKITFRFTFFGGAGPSVKITNIETAIVSKNNLSLNSNGQSGASRDSGGVDEGRGAGQNQLPTVPLDLPFGIQEVKDLSIQ
jgi:hypothetical protein